MNNYHLPLPYSEIDEKIQDKVNTTPQECPICHKPVFLELSYFTDTDYEHGSNTITYTLIGNCIECRINWELSIKQR